MTTLKQSWDKPSKPKPIMIIGAGGIIRDAHLPAYKKAGFEVIGVTDIDQDKAKKIASDNNIPNVYPNLKSAVAKHNTEVIYDFATPPDVLPELIKELPYNSAALLQKPMGANQEQAREIKQTCKEKNLKAAVNFQLKFSPMMLAAKDAINQGLIGDLLEIEVHVNIFTPWHLFPFLIPMKRVEIAVHSIHYLDTIRTFAGLPKSVFVRSMNDPRAPELAQTRTSAILDYGDKLRVIMSINHNHQAGRKFQSAWFRIEGTKGTMMVKFGVLYDYPNGEADELWISTNENEWEQITLEGSWFIDAFKGTMSNVQRFDAGEDDYLYASIDQSYETMALVEACFNSLNETGTIIQV